MFPLSCHPPLQCPQNHFLNLHTSAQPIHHTMEQAIPTASLTKQIHDPHACNIPDVQKNIDFIMEHLNDPNFDISHAPSSTPATEEEVARRYGQHGGEAIYFDESDLFYPFYHFTFLTTYHSESPYPEVRASVSSVDDPLMPVNTFRMWFLGILFSLLTSGANQVLYMQCTSLPPFVLKIILSTSS